MASKRELLQVAIRHEAGEVPSWTMAFFNYDLACELLGPENVMTDVLPQKEYKLGGADAENRLRNLRYARATDNYAIAVGKGGSFAFGHGGPGEFQDKLLQKNENEEISIYETGVKKLVRKHPHFYHNYDHPLESLDAAEDIVLPNASDPERYKGIAEDADFYRENGYLPYANLNGIFSAIHYYIYPYDKLFMDMVLEPENLHTLIKKVAEFNLTAAEQLLRCGVEMITTCDDMGDANSLLFSPQMYEEFFMSYHKELSNLCHSYGATLHLHSHGNIKRLLPLLVEAGIDIVNPIDPFEIGELEELKESFGDKLVLTGGMHRFFFSWPVEEMREFMQKTVSTGRKGGGYIWMDNGGIPEGVTPEVFAAYCKMSKEIRGA